MLRTLRIPLASASLKLLRQEYDFSTLLGSGQNSGIPSSTSVSSILDTEGNLDNFLLSLRLVFLVPSGKFSPPPMPGGEATGLGVDEMTGLPEMGLGVGTGVGGRFSGEPSNVPREGSR